MNRIPHLVDDGGPTPGAGAGAARAPVLVGRVSDPAGAAGNQILRGLPPHERARLLATLQPVTFALGDVVFDAGARIDHVYFPIGAVASALQTTEDGATVEMSLTGNDGLVGVTAVLGDDVAATQTVAVVAGSALMMRSATLCEEFAAGGALQALLLRYTRDLITQISQTAVCNRLHGAEQRLCRWLLMCRDRVDGNDLHMTQEFIAHMLGGRRETVTVAAGRLQDAGLIRYTRGQITILDRRGLEAAVCECYGLVENERERLASGDGARRRPGRSGSRD
jgi:CRP-like cAMP-binding protein